MKQLIALILALIMLLPLTSCESRDNLRFDYMFEEIGRKVLKDYISGKYGDELYYLASGGSWGGIGDIAIYKNGEYTQFDFYQSNDRCMSKKLTEEELNIFESFITENNIDTLSDWDTHMVDDGAEYQYMHFSKDNRTTFYMNNPDIIDMVKEHSIIDYDYFKDGEIYFELVNRFFSLSKTGSFEVQYNSSDDIKVLIKREEHFVESVWKHGDDFRVLVKDMDNSTYKHEILEWFKFENGTVCQKADDPYGFVMQNPWADIPSSEQVWTGDIVYLSGFLFEVHLNNFPWQAQWKSCFVRSLRQLNPSIHGLWLTEQGKEPTLISTGAYANPVVIPGTDWVVCAKADEGWANPSIVVKIDLNTLEETVIDLPKAAWMRPIIVINNKLLLLRNEKYNSSVSDYIIEFYMYDAKSDFLEKVEGDFHCLLTKTKRPLQISSESERLFVLEDDCIISSFNTRTFRSKKIASYEVSIDDMWVDEENNIVYAVSNGDLLELPLKLTLKDRFRMLIFQ